MPSIFDFMGYKIYFWSNENDEPIHVHVCKGKQVENATKFWIGRDGIISLECNTKQAPRYKGCYFIGRLSNREEDIILCTKNTITQKS